jgi:hypothetical protein
MIDLNLTTHLDEPKSVQALNIIDVKLYEEKLARIPKLVMVSSSDEYM